MTIWRTTLKRCLLAVVAAGVAFSFSQTGHAQAPCTIERGLDPLDVLNTGIRHNVWLVIDTSGSMGTADAVFGGQTRIQVARDVLTEVVNEFKDASGRPLVNWGIVTFGSNSGSSSCTDQFNGNNCNGLALAELVNPPDCDEPSNADDIVDELDAMVRSNGQPRRGGNTPNGISMDQISDQIVANGYVAALKTNQKNFVILVTDGDDTCECGDTGDISGTKDNGIWTPTPAPPFAGANTIPEQLRGDAVDPGYTWNLANQADRRAANAGTKGRLLYDRLNPTATDRADAAKGGAFVIGMAMTNANSQRRAHHMAWEASGAFYDSPFQQPALFGNDRAGLKQALRDAFARIGVPQAEVFLGAPIVGSVREAVPGFTNTTLQADELEGEVDPATVDTDDILEARKNRANHQNNVLFSTSIEVPGFKGHLRATNLYEVTDQLNPRTGRQADFSLMWDAGERLRDTSPNARNILFNRRGETVLRDFTSATAADLGVGIGYLSQIDGVGALTAEDARQIIIKTIQGYRLSLDPLTGSLYTGGVLNFSEFEADGTTPTWKMYDAVAPPALVLSPPRSPDFDPPQNHAAEYGVGGTTSDDGFYWKHFNRQTMVYLPTNAGVLHGIDAGTGDELFAYIPDDAMSLAPGEVAGSRDLLSDFVALVVAQNNGVVNHRFFLSGSPVVNDVFLRSDFTGDDDWHTMLTFGRARGGRFVTGLDISDPLNPLLRFNVGNREGISEGLYDGLGETWSAPVMGNVQTDSQGDATRVDQWLAFLGAGYGCENANNEGQFIYALRLEDGSIYFRGQVTNDTTAIIDHNAIVAAPTLYNPHIEDVADNKDFITRLYVGDVQGNIWKVVTLDQDPNNWTLVKFAALGDDQPITAPVALLADTNNQQIYVMAGTGGDARVDPPANGFKLVSYVDNDAEGANTAQYPLGSTPLFEQPLNGQERMYVAPVTVGQIGDPVPALVFFAGSTPTFDSITCLAGFTSSLYALGVESGQAEVDLDGGGLDTSINLGDTKVTGLAVRDGNLFVSKSGGLNSAGGTEMFGDGSFDDELPPSGAFNLQVLVDNFRLSPF